MITLCILQKKGPLTRRLTVSANSVERALQIARCGADEATIAFPIDGELFFAHVGSPNGDGGYAGGEAGGEGIRYDAMTTDEVEAAHEAGLPGAREAYLEVLRDDLGEQEFERYALENCLV